MCTSDNYVSPYLLRPLRSYAEYLRDQANNPRMKKGVDLNATSKSKGNDTRRYRAPTIMGAR